MNLMQAHKVCLEIDAQYGGGLRPVKWTEVFATEEQLVDAIRGIAVPKNRVAPDYTFKGYEYIFSFANRLHNGYALTEAQIRQAKRLAVEIKKANAISDYMREV